MNQPVLLTTKTRLIILSALIFSATTFSVQADSYDDGLMAFISGNYEKAGEHFITAAEQGNSGAEHMLMRLYSEGKLQAADRDTMVLKWTQRAADLGIKQAQFQLAEIYARKQGNIKKAYQWYRRAADKNHPDAYFELGEIYKNGADGIAADSHKSTHMYQIAASEYDVYAQKGNPEYQYALARMYQLAKGVNKDMKLAVKWMVKSAQQGYVLAQLGLGQLYAKGDDVDRNIREAKYWLSLAANQQTGTASTSANSLLGMLNQDKDATIAFALSH